MSKRKKLDYALGRNLKVVSKMPASQSSNQLKPSELFPILEEAIKQGDWRTYRRCFTRQATVEMDGQILSVNESVRHIQALGIPQTIQFAGVFQFM